MEIKEGDLVITLPKVEKINSIIDKLWKGKIGVVSSVSSRFESKKVYGVIIDGREFFLFADEIQKLEEKC
tara:strand:- start:784 stop:993 length:210 start_codon:yes stop_codon:yes gene_type:complete